MPERERETRTVGYTVLPALTVFTFPPLLESAPVALAALDIDGRVVAVNRALTDAWGCPAGRIIGTRFADCFEPQPGGAAAADLQSLLEGRTHEYLARGRYSLPRRIHEIDVRIAAAPQLADTRRLFLAALHEVTGRHDVDDTAERRAADMDAIFRSIPAAIYIGDEQGMRLANAEGLEKLGFSSVEQLQRHVSELSAQLENRDAVTGQRIDWKDEPFVRALAGERVDREIISRHVETGAEVVQRVIAAPVLIDGRIAGAVAINSDISARRSTEQALRMSEARYRALVEQAPLSIQIFSPDGRTLQVNRAWERLWGVTLDQIPEYNILQDPQLEARGLLPYIRRAFDGEASEVPAALYDPEQTISGRTSNPDSARWVRAVVYPLKDDDGRVTEVGLIHVDITEQVRTRQALEAASRSKDDFLATLSHELRTPLNAVVGWAHMLSSRPQDEETTRGLEVIRRNALAQARMIDDLLDMSRIVAGKLQLQLAAVDAGGAIRAALQSIRPGAEAKGVVLEEQIAEGLPEVLGDAERLQQVFWNLLSNAVKFTPPGGVIRTTAMADTGTVLITVTDTGMGISSEILPVVFDRFTQEDISSTRSHRGLGLGLAIVRHLVELHGGTVTASSDGPGRGATFSVWLPSTASAG